MEKAIIGGCDNLFVELSIPNEIKDNIEDVKAYIAGKREEFEAREAEMEKERFLIALEDFEAFNPHYNLEKPIKVKKGSILLVDGGFPHSQLTTMSDNGMTLFSSSTKEGYNDIWKICRANNVEIVDFRLIKNSKFMKETFLKPGAVKFPIFYWFEDYEVLPLCKQNEGKEYKMVDTFDMFGKPCGMVVKITDSDLCVLDENQRLIMIIDKPNENKPPVIRSTMREIKNQLENGMKELFSNIVVFNIEGLYRDIAKYQKKHKELPYLFMNSVTRKALANYVSNEPDITTFEGCKIFIDEDIEYGVVDVR